MKSLSIYIATFVRVENGIPIYKQVVDRYSHPFQWTAIQKEMYGLDWTLLFWKEITVEEYDFFHHNKLHHSSAHGG